MCILFLLLFVYSVTSFCSAINREIIQVQHWILLLVLQWYHTYAYCVVL
jgi:hypothetical protein